MENIQSGRDFLSGLCCQISYLRVLHAHPVILFKPATPFTLVSSGMSYCAGFKGGGLAGFEVGDLFGWLP